MKKKADDSRYHFFIVFPFLTEKELTNLNWIFHISHTQKNPTTLKNSSFCNPQDAKVEIIGFL